MWLFELKIFGIFEVLLIKLSKPISKAWIWLRVHKSNSCLFNFAEFCTIFRKLGFQYFRILKTLLTKATKRPWVALKRRCIPKWNLCPLIFVMFWQIFECPHFNIYYLKDFLLNLFNAFILQKISNYYDIFNRRPTANVKIVLYT